MYEVLEFFWKAIFFLQNGSYPHTHLPNSQEFSRITVLLIQYLPNTTISEIRFIFQIYNPGWQRNPRQRMQPRYGDEQTGSPPSKLYNRKTAERAVGYSSIVATGLVNLHRSILLQQPDLLVGILNGAFTRSRIEIKCNQAPYADGCSGKDWQRYLSRKANIKTRLKTISEIDNSLCCVVNPFGEAYPEKSTAPAVLPGYELIREYIFFGGVFITCGGMPFTYYFDANSGGPLVDTNKVLQNYPVAVRMVTVNGIPQIQVLGTTLLINNLIQKDFDTMPLMDDPATNRVGPFMSPIYQNAADRQFWACNTTNVSLNVFRPMDPAISRHVIPVVRTLVSGREVYPVSFARYGFGAIFHIGLDLSLGKQREVNFAKEAVYGFLQNYNRYLI